MVYQFSRIGDSLARPSLALMLAGFLSVTISLGTANGQITEGTTQPPESPKPRFPQLPDDQPDPKEVTPTTPKTNAGPDRNESVGRIRAIEKRTLKYQENEEKEVKSVLVATDAKITLNREPAKLSDLRVTDFVRVTTPPGRPEFAVQVAAARVIKDTPPQDPPPPPRVPSRTPRTRPEPMPDGQGGLGLVVRDNPGTGVLILEVNRETPAFEANIQTGDYLVQIDETEIVTPDDFFTHVRSHAPSEKVAITIWRDGKIRKGTVPLTTREAARDREVEAGKTLIISETRGDETVIKRRPRTVVLDPKPEDATVIVEQERAPLPREYDELAEKYLDLQDRLRQLELELERLKK